MKIPIYSRNFNILRETIYSRRNDEEFLRRSNYG